MTATARPERIAWLLALVIAIVPLWCSRDLPLVDLPQHSYVVDVLAHRNDPAPAYAIYAKYFEPRPGFRPYLGYTSWPARCRRLCR